MNRIACSPNPAVPKFSHYERTFPMSPPWYSPDLQGASDSLAAGGDSLAAGGDSLAAGGDWPGVGSGLEGDFGSHPCH